MALPLILTLAFDAQSFQKLDSLRQQHFPPRSYRLPAHITLFHALPGENEAQIREVLHEKCAQTVPISLRFGALRFLGRGVAVTVEAPQLLQLRADLAREWCADLTPQDAQNYRHPHVTIQNKVAPHIAREFMASLERSWEIWEGTGEGLLLWEYQNGPWKLVERFDFQIAEDVSPSTAR